jgi:hypothetical protein
MNIKYKLNNNVRKAQIGATITWFVAFLIIFFLMVVFVSFSTAIGVKKQASSIFSFENNRMMSVGDSSLVFDMNSIYAVLYSSSSVGDNKRIRDHLFNFEGLNEADKENLRKEIEGKLALICREYIFSVGDFSLSILSRDENGDSYFDLGNELSFNLRNGDKKLEIKYTKLREC